MKPSGLTNEALGDVLSATLTALGIDPENTAVYLRTEGVETQHVLIASEPGLLVAERRMLVNDAHNRFRLTMRLVPWNELAKLELETETIRDPELSPPAFVTTVTLTLPGIDGGSAARLKGSDDRLRAAPGNGFMVFAATCLHAVFPPRAADYLGEWIKPGTEE